MSMELAWQPADPMGEALHSLRMSSVFYCHSEFSEPWGLDIPVMKESLMFHFVTKGRCWLVAADGSRKSLQHGDLALVPHGEGHLLLSEPEAGIEPAKLFDLPRAYLSDRYEVIRHGGGGALCQVMCGAIRFKGQSAQLLIDALPAWICIESVATRYLDWIDSLLRFMAAEASSLKPGGEAVITRLADILVVQALRAWMESDPTARVGWLGALRDGQLGRAIAEMHREPGRGWTVDSLAKVAGMSRSAFAARFTERVGEPAMRYLARRRMAFAQERLAEAEVSLAELAAELGYESEAAFSRAFKRIVGISPGAARRAAASG